MHILGGMKLLKQGIICRRNGMSSLENVMRRSQEVNLEWPAAASHKPSLPLSCRRKVVKVRKSWQRLGGGFNWGFALLVRGLRGWSKMLVVLTMVVTLGMGCKLSFNRWVVISNSLLTNCHKSRTSCKRNEKYSQD